MQQQKETTTTTTPTTTAPNLCRNESFHTFINDQHFSNTFAGRQKPSEL
jgi:hypothetical protein